MSADGVGQRRDDLGAAARAIDDPAQADRLEDPPGGLDGERGEEEDTGADRGLELRDLLGDVEPGDAGGAQVQERDVRLMELDRGESRLPVHGDRDDLDRGLSDERPEQACPIGRVVIGVDDADRVGIGHAAATIADRVCRRHPPVGWSLGGGALTVEQRSGPSSRLARGHQARTAGVAAGPGSLPRRVLTGVIVPVHGFAPYLAEALDCVIAEGPDEIVVVDDGSPLPLELHPDHAAAGITVVRRELGGGPAQARADGLRALSVDVAAIALCDADDAWAPGLLGSLQVALAAEPGAGLAFGRALVVAPDGRPTGEQWPRPEPGRHQAGPWGRALYAQNPVPTSSVLLRRSALTAVGGFPAPVRVAEDWELWLRLARAGYDAVCVPEATVRYRRHPDGLTADVARLARAQLAVHAMHADLVDPVARHESEAADLAALADGLAAQGDARAARAAWGRVAEHRPLSRREQLKRIALAVPGSGRLRARDAPYR